MVNLKNNLFQNLLLPIISITIVWLWLIQFFPINGKYLGHDYSNFILVLFEGRIWFELNGFSIEWYTPAFGAGLPKFPDPQNLQYSLPQFLSYWFHPLSALKISFFILLSIGYFGMYRLSALFSKCSIFCHMGSILFISSSFFLTRMMIGHLTYHSFMLIPIFCYSGLFFLKCRNQISFISNSLIFSYFFYGGAGNFVPILLLIYGVVVFLYLEDTHNISAKKIALSFTPTCFGVILSLPQILSTLSFLEQFSRTHITPPQFSTLSESYFQILRLLTFGPFNNYNNEIISSSSFIVERHELEYSIGITICFVILVTVFIWLYQTIKAGFKIHRINYKSYFLIFFIFNITSILHYDSEITQAFIKSTPYLKNLSSLLRGLSFFTPILILLGVLSARYLNINFKASWKFSLLFTPLAFLNIFQISLDHYKSQSYDISNLNQAIVAYEANVFKPQIKTIHSDWGNHHFLFNSTSKKPYQPIFGYKLEYYPGKILRQGNPLMILKGPNQDYFNFLDPRCLVFPVENNCKGYPLFITSKKDELIKFLSYTPISHNIPFYLRCCLFLSGFAFLACIVVLLLELKFFIQTISKK